MYSDLDLLQVTCVCDAILALQSAELLLVVFDPVSDAQEDAEPMQTVHVARVRLGHSDQDLFRLGLAQDLRERLQKHLEVTFMSFIILSYLSSFDGILSYKVIAAKTSEKE